MGIGQGKGKTRAVDAAMAAISSPLLDFPITKAKGIVFNIVGGSDMSLQEINRYNFRLISARLCAMQTRHFLVCLILFCSLIDFLLRTTQCC